MADQRKNQNISERENQNTASQNQEAAEDSLMLHNSNHPGMVLVTFPLIGNNYLTWSTTIKISLEAKDKLCFVDGTFMPPNNPTEYKHWKKVDSMIKLWILNLILKELPDSFIYCPTAKLLWDEI